MATLLRAPKRKKYDYVVIGSGSAGSVMAARLAEDGKNRVLLLEAGPSDQHIHIRMPAALGLPLGSDRFNWRFESEPEPGLNGRTILEARGKVLGGSSSINGMNWVRGNPWDYDNWAAMGLEGWSYAEILPYFRRAESFDKGANDYRGDKGPMLVETCKAEGPLYDAFIQSAKQAGMRHVEDHNAYRQEGVHITQRNVGKGIRWSSSQGYIHARGNQPNLDVVVGGRLLKINFSNRRATRADILVNGERQSVEIDGEIILCAGALNSPQLLQLSGIGPADMLRSVGIEVLADMPGVGAGLKDHVAAPVQYRATQNVSAARHLNNFGKLKLGLQWLLAKKGLGATNFFEVGVFMRTRPEIAVPNVQFEFVPMLGEMQHGSVKLENGFQYFFSLMRPKSEGRVWLRDANPLSAPRFVFNYFAHEEDRRDAIDAVRAIRHVVSQPAWAPYRGEEVTPGKQLQTDEQIMEFLRQEAGTNYHPSCSARMGNDDNSVVDAQARVHGFDNLRVVDASIMPEIVSGNLNAPVIMMAEKLSDVVLGKQPLPRSEAPYYRPEGDAA
ncbi:choline dehydrogenase [Paracoccus denitrificans]|jgi:choline dehydrogenase|uniref:Glucose-methanol-choline oxidoreductase n=1 Tax=Paracoccus denitrificans (strain Pd 1222) TaxID=318586 RepID=A1B0W1_PARDP|nr:choline dehydrogenase [Paracoccus denitrificans]ABL69155.1 glucose-methanol-choline oxidoreductase [Paracoccus denitrificans PD1222]MBB4628986.1 choline dehydrogenase [Paracoccus denitrificans]MCU7430062.1 choline dehydrogenase [Paracoccus denitrificans]QAR27179.1 choline dehydrogenase [Paracoccus denitrificans]UPV96145.1 choline dehydrogenase [Paracoccus denitrificans]